MSYAGSSWTDSQLELLKIQLLDLVQDETRDGHVPEATQIAGHLTEDAELLATAAKALTTEDWVYDEPNLAGALFLAVTPAGSALVQSRRERRANRKLRALAAREALLDWCYEQGDLANLGNFPDDVRAHVEGDPSTEDEINQASRDLKEKGLIEGVGAWGAGIIRPTVTAAGKSVVEDYDSSIRAYETQGHAPKGQTAAIHIESSTISGQLVIGNENQISQNHGAGTAELAELVVAVLQAAKDTSEEARVGKLIAQLQLEADEDTPEATFIDKTVDRLEDAAAKTTSSALTHAVTQLAQYFHDHGIPQALGMG